VTAVGVVVESVRDRVVAKVIVDGVVVDPVTAVCDVADAADAEVVVDPATGVGVDVEPMKIGVLAGVSIDDVVVDSDTAVGIVVAE